MLELADQDTKTVLLSHMFRKLSRDMESIRKTQFILVEMNATVSKRGNTLDVVIWIICLTGKLHIAPVSNREFEDTAIEKIQLKHMGGK